MKQRDRKPKPQEQKERRRQQHRQEPPPQRLSFPEPDLPRMKPDG